MQSASASQALCSPSALPFWEHWGFEPWEQGPFCGVRRLQRFVKDGILGAVAEYRAIDYILWECGSEHERASLWTNARPVPGVMTQRFLFVMTASRQRKVRSFWLGFQGYAEWYEYRPLSPAEPALHLPADLTGLVDMAVQLPGKTGHTQPAP